MSSQFSPNFEFKRPNPKLQRVTLFFVKAEKERDDLNGCQSSPFILSIARRLILFIQLITRTLEGFYCHRQVVILRGTFLQRFHRKRERESFSSWLLIEHCPWDCSIALLHGVHKIASQYRSTICLIDLCLFRFTNSAKFSEMKVQSNFVRSNCRSEMCINFLLSLVFKPLSKGDNRT